MLNLKKKKLFFDQNGYTVIENILSDKSSYSYFDKVKNEINEDYHVNYDRIKKLGGYITGNLDLKPSMVILDIWSQLKKKNISEILEKLTTKSLANYDIKYAGNVSFPNKGDQFYHTDGPKKSKKILIGVPIQDLDENNGPTELIPGSHNIKISLHKFYLEKILKKKVKLILNKGDIFIRESYIWHKGTKNNSNSLRIVVLFILSEKNINFKNQQILEKIKLSDNMFHSSFSGKIREFISVYLPIIYFFYKIILSIIKK